MLENIARTLTGIGNPQTLENRAAFQRPGISQERRIVLGS